MSRTRRSLALVVPRPARPSRPPSLGIATRFIASTMDDSRCRRRRSAAPAAPPPQPRARSGLPGWARRSRYCCNVRGKACLQACPSLFLTALGADLERMFPHLRFLPPCLFEGRRLGQSWCTCSHMLEVVEVLYLSRVISILTDSVTCLCPCHIRLPSTARSAQPDMPPSTKQCERNCDTCNDTKRIRGGIDVEVSFAVPDWSVRSLECSWGINQPTSEGNP
ncbi:hypothetical protein F5883DRAFT_139814 [Diaporthe sp. PMI_573]|nr:hypothetical protein F5883DRAFT_139814 [Diaporthaceae sp. PMI_573]